MPTLLAFIPYCADLLLMNKPFEQIYDLSTKCIYYKECSGKIVYFFY